MEYRLEPVADPNLDRVVNAIATKFINGGVILRCLGATTTAFDDAFHRDLQGWPYLLRAFLESESLRTLIPELAVSVPIDPFPEFTTYGRYEFEGAIIELLLADGAYIDSTIDPETAREMARSFVDAMLGPTRDYVLVFRISGAWAGWFCDVAWDWSFAVCVPHARQWWLLCVTDTD